jgi:hypothetical protein
MGMGALSLASFFGGVEPLAASAQGVTGYATPLSPKFPHFPGKAKRVIHLFMNGGPSHVDTFDPKPALEKYAGKLLPRENPKTERKTGAAFPSPYKFKKYGQSGIEVSEIFPRVAECIDDIAVIRSMHADVPNHEPSLLLMNCGEARSIRPSLGSWVTYGLGTENANLPAFVVLQDNPATVVNGPRNWGAGFMPAVHQGTYISDKVEKQADGSDFRFVGLSAKEPLPTRFLEAGTAALAVCHRDRDLVARLPAGASPIPGRRESRLLRHHCESTRSCGRHRTRSRPRQRPRSCRDLPDPSRTRQEGLASRVPPCDGAFELSGDLGAHIGLCRAMGGQAVRADRMARAILPVHDPGRGRRGLQHPAREPGHSGAPAFRRRSGFEPGGPAWVRSGSFRSSVHPRYRH